MDGGKSGSASPHSPFSGGLGEDMGREKPGLGYCGCRAGKRQSGLKPVSVGCPSCCLSDGTVLGNEDERVKGQAGLTWGEWMWEGHSAGGGRGLVISGTGEAQSGGVGGVLEAAKRGRC